MSSENPEPSSVESVVEEAVAENFHDLPASTPSAEAAPEDPPHVAPPSTSRLFNRQRSLHQVLGGGKPADIFLWRDKFMSAGILVGSTVVWFLFEQTGYTLLTIVANLLLVSIGVLFVWSNAAVFLNRPPPPLPNLELSEEAATSLALAFRAELNKALVAAHAVALGKDFKVFLKVMAVLWGLSVVGGWFHFLTLVYLCIVVSHTIPAIYERYEAQIDSYAKIAFDGAHKQYRKFDAAVLSKVPRGAPKDKKTQ